MKPPTCTDALALAQAALEDLRRYDEADARYREVADDLNSMEWKNAAAERNDFHKHRLDNAEEREPQLAHWALSILSAADRWTRDLGYWLAVDLNSNVRIVDNDSYDERRLSPDEARALAAALLRAADEAER